MDIILKQRFVGIVVLFAILIIIGPAIYSSRDNLFPNHLKSNIPVAPDDSIKLPKLAAFTSMFEKSPASKPDGTVLIIPLNESKVKAKSKLKEQATAEVKTELKVAKIDSAEPVDTKPIIVEHSHPPSIESKSAESNVVVSKPDKSEFQSALSKIENDSRIQTQSKKQSTQALIATKPASSPNKIVAIQPTIVTVKPAAAIAESSSSRITEQSGRWVVQLGSFTNKSNATKLLDKLRHRGHESYMESIAGKNGMVYRVRVGPKTTKSVAKSLKNQIFKEMEVQGIVMRSPR